MTFREKGNERPQSAGLFGLSCVQATAAGWAVQVFSLPFLQPPLCSGEPSTRSSVPCPCTSSVTDTNTSIYVFGTRLLLMLLPSDHNMMACPVHSISSLLDAFDVIISHMHFPILWCFWAHGTGDTQAINCQLRWCYSTAKMHKCSSTGLSVLKCLRHVKALNNLSQE